MLTKHLQDSIVQNVDKTSTKKNRVSVNIRARKQSVRHYWQIGEQVEPINTLPPPLTTPKPVAAGN